MSRVNGLVVTAAVVAGVGSGALAQTARYTAVDLGRPADFTYSTVATAVNNHGVVVGYVQQTGYQAFVWRPETGMVLLPPAPGGEFGNTAIDINDNGDILGYAGWDNGIDVHGWIYRDGRYTMLGTLPGFVGSRPLAFNNTLEVVGLAEPASLTLPEHSFYWSPATGMTDPVPGSGAELNDINDAGVVCGGGSFNNRQGITTWNMRTGEVTDHGTLFGFDSYATALSINATGQLAGSTTSATSSGSRSTRGFRLTPGGEAVDLPAFHTSLTYARALNARGDVVGNSAFSNNINAVAWVWTPEHGAERLLDVVENPARFSRIYHAKAINDRGQIVASADIQVLNGQRRSILLTPIGPACAVDMNGDGAANVQDFLAFLQSYAAGEARADFDGSGAVNVQDFLGFLQAYAVGC
jgi:probable HAF family extracellular repeat protein